MKDEKLLLRYYQERIDSNATADDFSNLPAHLINSISNSFGFATFKLHLAFEVFANTIKKTKEFSTLKKALRKFL